MDYLGIVTGTIYNSSYSSKGKNIL
ncbi:hypothetical protein [uncultured Polaribacter sp.]